MNESAERKKPAYPIESVDNALRLLLLFREAPQVRVSQCAKDLGVAPSTAHRLLAMLEYHGFVERDGLSKAYSPGPSLLSIGLEAIHGLDIRQRARPHLEALAAECGETVNLLMLEGAEVRFVDSVESAQAVRIAARVGLAMPAHCTSVGKALLAQLDEADVLSRLTSEELVGIAPGKVRTRSDLLAELEEVRSLGYATNLGESHPEVGAVGVAIPHGVGTPLPCGIGISIPMSRLTREELPHLAQRLMSVARSL